MEKVKTAIIGCGKVAHIHAKALKNLHYSQFTSVCSRTRDKAKKFASQYGVKPYTDVEKMISESGVEAVLICTPHPAHAEPAVKAAECGAHILVEKPLASSLKDCDLMIEAARKAKVKLSVISQRRLYSPSLRVKKAIVDGRLGEPVLGVANLFGWRDKNYYESDPWRGSWKGEGGGVLVNQAPHQLDLLLWYMGEIEELYGYWSNFNHPYIEVEDTATAVIKFKSGALGNIIVSNSQNPALHGRVNVFGDSGAAIGVQTDGGAMFIAGMSKIEEAPYNHLWTVPGEENNWDVWKKEDAELFKRIDAINYYHERQIEDFLCAVIDNGEPMISPEEGRRTVELYSAIYKSQKINEVVKFPLEKY
jgi:predicted dehydrogenase